MEWPSASFQAQAWGAGASHAGVDPDSRPALISHFIGCGLERTAFEPILDEIAACARARNAHVAAILAARKPQGDLFGPPPGRSRTWSSMGVAKIKRDLQGGPRTRRIA